MKRIHAPYSRLKGALRERGLTYSDVAELLSLTPTTVSSKINGSSDFYISEIEALEKKCGIKKEFFLV